MAAHPVEALESLDAGAEPGVGAKVLRGFVASAVSAAPGPELVTALMALTARTDLTAREWVEVTAAWKKVACLATAGQFVAIAELDQALNPGLGAGDHADADGDAYAGPGRTCPVRRTADELAPALGMAPRAASALVSLVRRCEDLPAAMDALADGRMDPSQLRALDAARPAPAHPGEAGVGGGGGAVGTTTDPPTARRRPGRRSDPARPHPRHRHGRARRDRAGRPAADLTTGRVPAAGRRPAHRPGPRRLARPQRRRPHRPPQPRRRK